MPYRKFDTGTWQDPWFENLSAECKLAFIYFWTNEICNPAGIYEISEKRILFELGYHIDTISDSLIEKIVWYPEYKTIWVKNFFKRQCQNGKFAVAALNSLRNDLFKIQVFINYNHDLLVKHNIDLSGFKKDTISIPYLIEQNRAVQ